MDAVKVNGLCFSYGDIDVFDDVHFIVEKGSFTTVLGSGGSGKSTLFKILCGDVFFEGNVLIFNKSLNYALDKEYIGIISPFYKFKGSVFDKFVCILRDKGRPLDKIKGDIERIVKKLSIEDILGCNYGDLSYKKKILVMVAIMILSKPKLILIDNALGYLDDEIDMVVKEIKRLNKKSTIINITNRCEECIYGNEVLILDNFIKYKVREMSEDDFTDNGLEAPFIISLSSKLRFYGAILNNYVDMERLVDDLWQ